MISLTLPYPIAADRYWKSVVPNGETEPVMSVTPEGRLYREQVCHSVRQAGVYEPLDGRLSLSYVLYPARPDDWRERVRMAPESWDDEVDCGGMDKVQKVLFDSLRGVAFEDEGKIRRVEAERAVPDGHERIELKIGLLDGVIAQKDENAHWHETRHGIAYFYPPGTIVATPSGRQAVVLRYLHGTGKVDTFERAICRYLDSTSMKECVTLQPQFLRRIA